MLNASLRLLLPSCNTPAAWSEEALPQQAARAVRRLTSAVTSDGALSGAGLLPSSAICCSQYLLGSVLRDGGKVVRLVAVPDMTEIRVIPSLPVPSPPTVRRFFLFTVCGFCRHAGFVYYSCRGISVTIAFIHAGA